MTVLIGLTSDDDSSKHVDEINKFATYSKTNFLELNAKMTKEMIIDFRKSKAPILLLLMIILLNMLEPINI